MATLSGLDLRVGEEMKASTASGGKRIPPMRVMDVSVVCFHASYLTQVGLHTTDWIDLRVGSSLTRRTASLKHAWMACSGVTSRTIPWPHCVCDVMTFLIATKNTKEHPCNVDLCYDITKIREYSLDIKVLHINGRLLAHRMMYALWRVCVRW